MVIDADLTRPILKGTGARMSFVAATAGVSFALMSRLPVSGTTLNLGTLGLFLVAVLFGAKHVAAGVRALGRSSPLLLIVLYALVLSPILVAFANQSTILSSQLGLLLLPAQWVATLGLGYGLARSRYAAIVLRSFLIGNVVVSIPFLITQIGGSSFGALQRVRSWDTATKLATRGLGFSRPTGAYLNPNNLAALGLVLLAFGLASTKRSDRIVFSIVGLFFILAGGSRGFLLGAILILIVRLRGRTGHSVHVFMIVVVGIIPALLLAPQYVLTRFALSPASLLADPSIEGRYNQILGTGILKGSYILGSGRPPGLVTGTSLDSDWIYFAVLLGIPLTIMLILSLFLATRRVLSDSTALALLPHLLFVGIFWSGFAQTGLISTPGLVLLFSLGVTLGHYPIDPMLCPHSSIRDRSIAESDYASRIARN